MSKVPLIIAREYLARTKKKSFIITTILMPVLMALLVILPVYISYKSEREVTIFVYDESNSYLNKFQNTDKMKFVFGTILNERLAHTFNKTLPKRFA